MLTGGEREAHERLAVDGEDLIADVELPGARGGRVGRHVGEQRRREKRTPTGIHEHDAKQLAASLRHRHEPLSIARRELSQLRAEQLLREQHRPVHSARSVRRASSVEARALARRRRRQLRLRELDAVRLEELDVRHLKRLTDRLRDQLRLNSDGCLHLFFR